jgi:hypothetical protein
MELVNANSTSAASPQFFYKISKPNTVLMIEFILLSDPCSHCDDLLSSKTLIDEVGNKF